MQLREKLNMMAMCRGQSSQSAKASAGEEGTKSTVAEVEDVVHKLREQEEPEDGHRTVEGQIDDAIDDELNEFEKGQCYVCIIIIITATTTTTTIIIIIIIIIVELHNKVKLCGIGLPSKESTNKGVNQCLKDVTGVQQQRPESPVVIFD